MVPMETGPLLRRNRDILLRDVRKAGAQRLWLLDSQVWRTNGTIRNCLSATLDEVCANFEREPTLPARSTQWDLPFIKPDCARLWGETGLDWSDTTALIDILREHCLRIVPVEAIDRAGWVVQAVLNALKVDIATIHLNAQAADLARQRDEGVATQHLAGRLLANASHDLRTPLTAVLGFSELLLEETYGVINEDQRTAIGHIENSSQNLLEIVNNLLDLMQYRAGKLVLQYKRVEAQPLLRRIYQTLLPLAIRRKVRFREQLSDDLGSFEADEGIVRHIVYHLLENALRATPPEGEVVLWAERSATTLTVVTYDTALHFPPAAIENMNDAFPILENSPARGYEGWEVGLPLVRRYVDLHAGTLNIESDPESGTTIRVNLPVKRPSGASAKGRISAGKTG